MYAIRPWLYIGGFRDSTNAELLALYGIGAVLQLAGPWPAPGCETLALAVEDGEPIPPQALRAGVDFVAAARRAGRRSLVACGAGISRSVTFATATLCEVERLGLLAAAAEVKRGNPDAVFHPLLWESLTAFTGDQVPFREVLLRIGP
jgi:hypothetical protein